MNLRREAIETLFPDQPGPNTYRLDALLDWLDTNAERIERQSKLDAYDIEHDRWIGDDVEADEVRRLVAVLRGNT